MLINPTMSRSSPLEEAPPPLLWMLVLTVLRLPPGLQSVGSERGDDVLDAMALRLLRQLIVRLRGVAREALLLLLVVERWGRRGVRG